MNPTATDPLRVVSILSRLLSIDPPVDLHPILFPPSEYMCDVCKEIIRLDGRRYKCTFCRELDFCQRCHSGGEYQSIPCQSSSSSESAILAPVSNSAASTSPSIISASPESSSWPTPAAAVLQIASGAVASSSSCAVPSSSSMASAAHNIYEVRQVDEKLVCACIRGDVDTCKALIQQGANVNTLYKQAHLLRWSAVLGYSEMCKYLLAIQPASSYPRIPNRPHVELLRTVLVQGSYDSLEEKTTAAKDRCDQRAAKCLDVLITHGRDDPECDVNQVSALVSMSLLQMSCALGLPHCCSVLLAHGADPNRVLGGSAAIHAAISSVIPASVECVRALLLHSATDVNLLSPSLALRPIELLQLPHSRPYAIQKLNLLLSCSRQLPVNDTAAFQMAVGAADVGAVKLLLQHGAKVGHKLWGDFNSLHVASASDNNLSLVRPFWNQNPFQLTDPSVKVATDALLDQLQRRKSYENLSLHLTSLFQSQQQYRKRNLCLDRDGEDFVDADGSAMDHASAYVPSQYSMQLPLHRQNPLDLAKEKDQAPVEVDEDQAEVFRLLLQNANKPADVNAVDRYSGLTPLHIASTRGVLEYVEYLVEAGADVNVISRSDLSPLAAAAESGFPQVCAYLMSKAAQLQPAASKNALASATQYGFIECCRILMQHPNVTQDHLNEALFVAARYDRAQILAILVKAGADVSARDPSSGRTPADEAILNNSVDAVRTLLLEYNLMINLDVALQLANFTQFDEMSAFLESGQHEPQNQNQVQTSASIVDETAALCPSSASIRTARSSDANSRLCLPVTPPVSASGASSHSSGTSNGCRFPSCFALRPWHCILTPQWQFRFGPLLGTGGFGGVYQAEWRGITVAVKGRLTRKRTSDGRLTRELETLERLTNKTYELRREARAFVRANRASPNHTIKLLGQLDLSLDFFLVCEFAQWGSLKACLDPHSRFPWNRELQIQLLQDLSCGLSELHSHYLVHGDIKSANILMVNSNEVNMKGGDDPSAPAAAVLPKLSAKYTDFGSAKASFYAEPFKGRTALYCSLADLQEPSATTAMDVYGLGLVLFEVLTGKCIEYHSEWLTSVSTPRGQIDQVNVGHLHSVMSSSEFDWVGAALKESMFKCLLPTPSARPTAADIHRICSSACRFDQIEKKQTQ